MIQPETAPKSHFEKLNHRLLPPFWSSSHITSRAQCSKSASTQDFARKSLFGCVVDMFLNRVFQQEPFNRFLCFLASLIKNDRTLRICYLFSCKV